MKNKVIIMMLLLAVSLTTIYFINYKENTTEIVQEKTYTLVDEHNTKNKKLEDYAFYNQGVVTFSKTKLINEKLTGETVWEKDSKRFYDNVYVFDDYIYRTTDNILEVTNAEGENYILSGITGKIINVSRENNKVSIITQTNDGTNLLYILGENHEMFVEAKEYRDKLVSVNTNPKADNYVTAGFKISGKNIVSIITYSLYDGLDLCNFEIEGELVLDTYIIANNILVVTDSGVHFYDSQGNIIWNFSSFDRLYKSNLDEVNHTIDILVDKNNQRSYIELTYDGVIKFEANFKEKVENIKKLDIYTFIYDNNNVYILNGQKLDKVWTSTEKIKDVTLIDKYIYIMQNDGIIRGKIKLK